MPVALYAAGDIVVIAGAIVILGMLLAVNYTFVPMALMFNVITVLGYHPFRWLSTLLYNTIIRWCEKGISATEGAISHLWYGLGWSINEMLVGIRALADATEHTLHALRHVVLPRVIHANTLPILHSIHTLTLRLAAAERHAIMAEQKLGHGMATSAAITEKRLSTMINNAIAGTADGFEARIGAVERTLERELARVPGEVARAEDTVAGRLYDLGRVAPIATIAGLTAAFPLVRASVHALEREAGLETRQCRNNVKGICGVNPRHWLNFLFGLAALETGLSLRELMPLARRGIHELDDVVRRAG